MASWILLFQILLLHLGLEDEYGTLHYRWQGKLDHLLAVIQSWTTHGTCIDLDSRSLHPCNIQHLEGC